MLTPLDDYLIHQTPYPLAYTYTSDRNFYDRYYFNCHNLEGDVFLVVGMGLYPNIGVIDAFATCAVEGKKQYVVKASRELRFDRSNTKVGPIAVEVLEGLRRLRVVCEPNEWGLQFDLTFDTSFYPFQEPHFDRYAGVRKVMDYTRITQAGRWTGILAVGDRTFQVTREGWRGGRDHSWGVRPIGGDPPSAPAPGALTGFHWQWSVWQTEDEAFAYTISENPDGTRWHENLERVREFDPASVERLSLVRHELRLKPGTRVFDGGTLWVRGASGREFDVRFEPKQTLFMAGAGYALLGGWRHGQYHGPLAVEGEVWDLTDAETLAKIQGQNETVCDVLYEGRRGSGIFELLVIGPYEPWKLTGFLDGAPAESPASR